MTLGDTRPPEGPRLARQPRPGREPSRSRSAANSVRLARLGHYSPSDQDFKIAGRVFDETGRSGRGVAPWRIAISFRGKTRERDRAFFAGKRWMTKCSMLKEQSGVGTTDVIGRLLWPQTGTICPCTAETQAACRNVKLSEKRQVSIRHHYIPVFYTKRWCTNDGRLCEYSRPHDKIHDQRLAPKTTGFQDRLYEIKGVPQLIAQRIEDDFMSFVDNHAAAALALLETDSTKINGDQKHKSAWSLFLISLIMRTPEDVSALIAIWEDDWERDFEKLRAQYEKNKKPGEMRSLEEFIAQEDPHVRERWAMSELPELIDHEGIGQLLNDMHWFVITTDPGSPHLLTSDRPLSISGKLGAQDCYL